MDILDFVPDYVKRQLQDKLVEFLVERAEKLGSGEQIIRTLRAFGSDAEFHASFKTAFERAIQRFQTEYLAEDEDLTVAIISDTDFWKAASVQKAVQALVRQPGAWQPEAWATVVEHFADVLPQRVNRVRVDRAVSVLLRCLAQELWSLPGLNEIREVYNIQFQRVSAEAAQRQVQLLEAQLRVTTQLSTEIREAFVQLTGTLGRQLLAAPTTLVSLPRPRPYHNVPQPDYIRFIGREEERAWLRTRLAPEDRAWQIALTGIGGVGKSALAQAIAYEYREQYGQLPSAERFEAIIWVSAKEEVLTTLGREQANLPGLICHTLEDIYSTIAQTLDREDITRGLPSDQDRLVRKALAEQRTLLILDNMETVTDVRVKPFLRSLPEPTKAIVTSRELVDVADVWVLQSLMPEDALRMISEETIARRVSLTFAQQHLLMDRTKGLPLPIKLSLARLAGGETMDQVIRWLANQEGDLPQYCVAGQAELVRGRNPDAWRLLLACSLSARDAGAVREALGMVANVSEDSRDMGLTDLLRLSLVNRTTEDRFWLLPIVQEYVSAQLTHSELVTDLNNRWVEWLVNIVKSNPLDELRANNAPIIGQEYLNIRNAIYWCHERQQWKSLLWLVEAIQLYPYLNGLFAEFQELVQLGLRAADVIGDKRAEAKLEAHLGRLAWAQGDYGKAVTEYLHKAEQIALQQDDKATLGYIWRIHVDILLQQDPDQGEKLAYKLLDLTDQTGNPRFKGEALGRLAQIAAKRGDFRKASELMAESEALFREFFDGSRALAWCIHWRVLILMEEGNFERAESPLLESLDMADSWSDRRLIALNTFYLAQVYAHTGRIALAQHKAEEVYDAFGRLGMTEWQANTMKLIG